MVEILLEAAWFLLAMGLVEAVVKPVAKRFTQRKLLRWMPALLRAMDPLMPAWLLECSGEELELRVREMAEELTGEDWSDVNLKPLWERFDARVCAERNLTRG